MDAQQVLNFLNECSKLDPEFKNQMVLTKNEVNSKLLSFIESHTSDKCNINRWIAIESRANTYGYSYVYLLEIINSMLSYSGETKRIIVGNADNCNPPFCIKDK